MTALLPSGRVYDLVKIYQLREGKQARKSKSESSRPCAALVVAKETKFSLFRGGEALYLRVGNHEFKPGRSTLTSDLSTDYYSRADYYSRVLEWVRALSAGRLVLGPRGSELRYRKLTRRPRIWFWAQTCNFMISGLAITIDSFICTFGGIFRLRHFFLLQRCQVLVKKGWYLRYNIYIWI